MLVPGLRFVERLPFPLDPGVRFEPFSMLANPDPEIGGDAFPPQQPPEGEGFFEAGRPANPVAHRGAHHSRYENRALRRNNLYRWALRRQKPPEKILRPLKTS